MASSQPKPGGTTTGKTGAGATGTKGVRRKQERSQGDGPRSGAVTQGSLKEALKRLKSQNYR